MTEFAKTSTDEASVTDAFRSPPPAAVPKDSDGVLRLRIYPQESLQVQSIPPSGWAAFWSIFIPGATVVQISGRINVTLRVYPLHVQIENRRWHGDLGMFGYSVSIPVFDEIGDDKIFTFHARSKMAFLYPFVPMHVEVAIDNEVIFGQGKFRQS